MIHKAMGYLQEYANELQDRLVNLTEAQAKDHDSEAADEAAQVIEKIEDIKKLVRFLSNVKI